MTKIQTQTISRGHEIYSNKTNIRMEELEISLDERSEYTPEVGIRDSFPGSHGQGPENLGFAVSGTGTGRLKAKKTGVFGIGP